MFPSVRRNFMPSLNQHVMSRRGFCLCCMAATTLAATGGWLPPRQAFAAARDIVGLIRDDAAKAPLNVHKTRAQGRHPTGTRGKHAVMPGAPRRGCFVQD